MDPRRRHQAGPEAAGRARVGGQPDHPHRGPRASGSSSPPPPFTTTRICWGSNPSSSRRDRTTSPASRGRRYVSTTAVDPVTGAPDRGAARDAHSGGYCSPDTAERYRPARRPGPRSCGPRPAGPGLDRTLPARDHHGRMARRRIATGVGSGRAAHKRRIGLMARSTRAGTPTLRPPRRPVDVRRPPDQARPRRRGVEAYDDPPDEPTEPELARIEADLPGGADDLRRVDDAERTLGDLVYHRAHELGGARRWGPPRDRHLLIRGRTIRWAAPVGPGRRRQRPARTKARRPWGRWATQLTVTARTWPVPELGWPGSSPGSAEPGRSPGALAPAGA